MLGSVADLSLRESNMSVFIGKRKHIADHTIFVVGVDGSETAHDAVCLAIRLARPTDRIVLIHIEDASAQPVLSGPAGENKSERFDADVVEARYHAFIAARPSSGVCECVFKRILKPVGSAGGVSDTFLDAAQEEDAEIVLVGIDGLGAKAHGHKARVGSNTDNVVK